MPDLGFNIRRAIVYVAWVEAYVVVLVLTELLVILVSAVRALVIVLSPTSFFIVSVLYYTRKITLSHHLLFLAFLELDPPDWPSGAFIDWSLQGLKVNCLRLDTLG